MNRIVLCLLFLVFAQYTLRSQSDTTRLFAFGHSLVDHRPPAFPTPSNETSILHWISILSDEAGHRLEATGQFGFLVSHLNLPPIANWGYDTVPPAWDSDNETFAEADFSTVLMTAGNFMQWQGPGEDYPTDPGISPISATDSLISWCSNQENNIRFYIYENWPDMAPYLGAGFPPTEAEFQNYNHYTQAEFHDWWLEYQDSILARLPDIETRMIPVGPIISTILEDSLFDSIPITELYEDDAPHGRASIYFLAGLISYMAIYEEEAPLDYTVPPTVHPTLTLHYEILVDMIWSELIDFQMDNGSSRVFFDNITAAVDVELEDDMIHLYPNPTDGLFQIKGDLSSYNIEILDGQGHIYETLQNIGFREVINISDLPDGLYFIRLTSPAHGPLSLEKIVKMGQ